MVDVTGIPKAKGYSRHRQRYCDEDGRYSPTGQLSAKEELPPGNLLPADLQMKGECTHEDCMIKSEDMSEGCTCEFIPHITANHPPASNDAPVRAQVVLEYISFGVMSL